LQRPTRIPISLETKIEKIDTANERESVPEESPRRQGASSWNRRLEKKNKKKRWNSGNRNNDEASARNSFLAVSLFLCSTATEVLPLLCQYYISVRVCYLLHP
jgi:hypothetical protein